MKFKTQHKLVTSKLSSTLVCAVFSAGFSEVSAAKPIAILFTDAIFTHRNLFITIYVISLIVKNSNQMSFISFVKFHSMYTNSALVNDFIYATGPKREM